MSRRGATPDLPLLRWGDELRRRAAARRRMRRRIGITVAGIALLGATIVVPPLPRLVWNASASAPVGLYRVLPAMPVRTGDMVIAWPPERLRRLAAGRRYLPMNVPLVKLVAASPGDIVCAFGNAIFVNGHRVAERRPRDGKGRPMPWWRGCVTLQGGAVLLLMADSPSSFDGRYFGPTGTGDVIGKAQLLWAR